MVDYVDFIQALASSKLAGWLAGFRLAIYRALVDNAHGDLPVWQDALDRLPELTLSSIDLNASTVRAGVASDADDAQRAILQEQLMRLHPWRKGPFEIAGLKIDTEWRSDWKWDRVLPHIAPLAGRTVLDVGCGSGYHCWRMAGAGAAMTVGIEPAQLYVMQYWAMRRYLGVNNCWVLPLALEDLPAGLTGFDTIFSMGVLYHRRSPFEHITQLRELLRPGGELVLETLVVEGNENTVLVPEDRYAQMRNVWCLPAPAALEKWMRKCGLVNVRTVDLTPTSVEEQRSTSWMKFDSLSSFIDPADPRLTVEGLPAPVRAVVIANAP